MLLPEAPKASPQDAAPTILEGLLDRKHLAVEIGRSERTIHRYQQAGMPCQRVGWMMLYELNKVRAWMSRHERHRKEAA